MSTPSTRDLIAAGFDELDRAAAFLQDDQLRTIGRPELLGTLRRAPDADQALLLLIRLLEQAPDVLALFEEVSDGHHPQAVPLIRLLGSSRALGEFLVRRPDAVRVVFDHREEADLPSPDGRPRVDDAEDLRRVLLEEVRAVPGSETPVARLDDGFTARDAAVALRVAYRRLLTAVALRDLTASDPLAYQPLVSQQLADLAAAAVEAALAVTRAELVERHGPIAQQVELGVIGMGKCGARELNYISDVDVVFVHRGPEDVDDAQVSSIAGGLAGGISKVINSSAPEPGLWEVDANLRPEGKDGPLTRTLESHVEYYKRWAHGWEFQALLKARPIAGSSALGEAYITTLWPLVWSSSQQPEFVENVQRMRRRVFEHIPAEHVDREIKLGRGGLRDIEFTVQLLQLVHGRVDEELHVRDTLTAIRALGEGEYMASRDQEAMSRCYRQLRLYEHRIQMSNMRRTHLMPRREPELRALAHAVRPPQADRRDSAEDLLKAWRSVVREVASFHETIFYRPLLSTTAVLSDEEVRLSSQAAQDRLAALGYSDTSGAMRHIEALTAGVTRRATLQRRILPMMLGWFAEGVDPDSGLLAFRRLSESLGTSPWYLTMLRDSSVAAERLCHILTSSRFISDLLEHSPESSRWLGDDSALRPLSFESLWTEIRNQLARHEGDASTAVRLTRLVRQREVLRIAIADAAGLLELDEVGRALSDVDRAATLGALHVAEREVFAEQGEHVKFLVVAMGRQGGQEISYGSDMDAMFVHRAVEGADPTVADEQARRLATRLTALLSQSVKPPVRGEDPLKLDTDLRPEGKTGPISRTLESFREYYRRWMDVWERQALLRARPIAGCDELAADVMELVDEVRYAPAPSESEVREIRRIKARVESERLPRGADPSRHVKLGRGGLSDVEWLAQLLQLQHAYEHPELRVTNTLDTLEVLVQHELLAAEDAAVLAEAWRLCTRARAAMKVWSGRTSDVLPSSRRDLEAVARWCGFDAGSAAAFEEHYLRTTRRCRQVYERLFYEDV
ncbi:MULTISPECIES: bifunctional [glutamine synthetase] adenylyltransferase/[glutamine synthetase]-adenylyl-L-tyrosine phosphorylase [Actinomycetes]|uniref:Bifunctional [glutamine synthetase] adenylyltransferase/[glutamine synthetase]-adenylyl-L-tyrosine phosphorylase n=2 Tax=Actinomycetes TaxID=1760 RepID=A0ABP6LP61_9MICC